MQNEDDGHETDIPPLPGSMDKGADQVEPFQERALPLPSTARQNARDTQETDVMPKPPPLGSITCGWVHFPSIYPTPYPPDPAAMQNNAEGQETE